jgi:hypothetical protein
MRGDDSRSRVPARAYHQLARRRASRAPEYEPPSVASILSREFAGFSGASAFGGVQLRKNVDAGSAASDS